MSLKRLILRHRGIFCGALFGGLVIGLCAFAQYIPVSATHVYDIGNGVAIKLANSATGTTTNKLVKLDAAGAAIITATTDTSGIIGIASEGAGTTGSASVKIQGYASCVFDSAVTIGNYIVNDTSTAGDCQDAGATKPTTSQPLGKVLETNAGAGTYPVLLYGPDQGGGAAGAPTDFSYLGLGTNASLTAERVFAPGHLLSAVDGGANGNYTVSYDPTNASAVAFDEEFIAQPTADNTGARRWTQVTLGSGCAASVQGASEANHIGVYNIITAAGSADGCVFTINGQTPVVVLNPHNTTWKAVIIFRLISAADVRMRCGFVNPATTAAPADGIFVRFDTTGTPDTNFRLVNRTSSSDGTPADTGVAGDTNWHRVNIRRDAGTASGTTIWNFDGAGDASVTGATTASLTLGCAFATATTASKTLALDKFSSLWEVTR